MIIFKIYNISSRFKFSQHESTEATYCHAPLPRFRQNEIVWIFTKFIVTLQRFSRKVGRGERPRVMKLF